MKFPYIKVPTQDAKRKWIARPMIPIVLSAQRGIVAQSVNIDALLDSGADKCLFNAEIGEALGLSVEEGKPEYFGGIEGGKLDAFVHKVKVQIRGSDQAIEVSAGFVYAKGVSAILGQEDFFDSFRIKFERDHNLIEIAPSPKR